MILILAPTVWACESDCIYCKEIITLTEIPRGMENKVINITESDTDRFLREQVQPNLWDAKGISDMAYDMKNKEDKIYHEQRAIYKLLLALVEIEQERLRREAE